MRGETLSVDDQERAMCCGPTSVAVMTGVEGAMVSAGSVALTVLLLLDTFPAASKALT